jgi:hypothetical protein
MLLICSFSFRYLCLFSFKLSYYSSTHHSVIPVRSFANFLFKFFSDISTFSFTYSFILDVEKNMLMRTLLREPQTVYILMTRNYADMMWYAMLCCAVQFAVAVVVCDTCYMCRCYHSCCAALDCAMLKHSDTNFPPP